MTSTTVSAISAGQVIDGRFPLLRRLGGSEWSSAYLTELNDDGPPKKAAIKIFPFACVEAQATMAQWDVARTLSHAHLMPLFHAARVEVEGEDLLYVVTEYADETLSQILPERPLTTAEAREMLGPVLDALSYLHKRSLTHGHLRPTNIMVVDDRVKLSPDFGWRGRRRSIYDPPEAGAEHLSGAADIWSLGVLLVESLTQEPPAWDRLQGGEPEVPASMPEPFYTIARECLQVDPAERCTIAAIKAHLNPPQAAVESESTDDDISEPSYKVRAMMITGAVVVLSLIIAMFKFGFDLEMSEPAPQHAAMPQTAAPVVQPQAPVSEPVAAAPAATAAVVPEPTTAAPEAAAPEAATNAKPGATLTPAAAETKDGVGMRPGAGAIAHQVLPAIPGDILRTIHGHVNVGIRVAVDAKGNVSQATIDSPGPSRYFANKSLQAAQNWKFKPAGDDGRAGASAWILLFQYGDSGVAATATEEAP